MILIIINLVIKYKDNKKELIAKVIVAILPIIILQGSLIATRLVNYKSYGVYTYNEINDGYFGKVLQTIYSVKQEKDIKYVTASREKINKLYEVSPTLNSIKEHLESSLNGWDLCDRNPGDNEVEDGWFWWALKGAVANAGYYDTAVNSDNFYKKVYDELQQAIKEGKLETQFSMPAKLMSPWKARYFGEEISTMVEFTNYVATYEGAYTISNESKSSDNTITPIRQYETLTHDFAIYPSKSNTLNAVGWVFVKDDKDFDITLLKNDKEINSISKIESEDVYNYFGTEYKNTKKCRFKINSDITEIKETDTIYLSIKNKDGKEIEKINLNNAQSGITETNNLIYNFDSISGLKDNVDSYYLYSKPYVKILNKIGDIYRFVGLPFAILACVAYIIFTILIIIKKRIREENIDLWLLLTGILCSFLVLIAGVSYNHITACFSKYYMYLSGAYPLLIAFVTMTIMKTIEEIKSFIVKKYKKEN